MCAVSNMSDMYRDKFSDPWWSPSPINPFPNPIPNLPINPLISSADGLMINLRPAVSREEFDALKKMVEEMRDVLLAAKKYDEQTGQPDCEMDDKVSILKQVAKLVGVDLEAVFGAK